MKKAFFIILLAGTITLLSGCVTSSEELLSVPKAPSQYLELQNSLDKILSQNAQYISPVSGNNRNSIQLVDLDGDGIDEVLSCFLVKSGEASVPRVYIHKLTGDEYAEIGYIDGYGDSIDSIWYPKLFFGDERAVAIGWRLGTSPKCGITVISYLDDTLRTLYSGEYTALTVVDLNMDDADELVLLDYSSTSEPGRAKLLSYESNELTEISSAPLSQGIVSPGKVRTAYIGANTPAVISEGMMYDSGYVSDCLIFSGGILKNVFYAEEHDYSMQTFRTMPIYSSDINNDGIIEFPKPELVPGTLGMQLFWRIDWCQYNADTKLVHTVSTFHNIYDRWMYIFPEELIGKITVTRGEDSENASSIVFRSIESDGTIGTALWEIYSISGEGRREFLTRYGLSELARTFDTIYACKIIDNTHELSQSLSDIKQRFDLVQNEWIYENWAIPSN